MSVNYPIQTNVFPVMEHFYTIQGEGVYSGIPAYFIRLAGCDVGCVWCDVKESWNVKGHPKMSVEIMLEKVQASKAKIVVITGGEPAMYDLTELTTLFNEKGYRTHIETSGAYEITGSWDWVCLSPKKFKPPIKTSYLKADELKVIVFNQHDFQWAEQNAQYVSEKCVLILNPEWGKRDKVMPLIVSYAKENIQWRIGLQMHKYLQVP